MPHLRSRLLTPIITKRLKLWPVLGLIGVRQCGKSVLLRDQLQEKIDCDYVTLDSKTQRVRAERTPEAFTGGDSRTLIIDEVQKAPDLFDAIKLHVDRNRRPGRFLISGSTEFSQYTGIRESLTGRIGILHLYPLNLSELQQATLGGYWSKWRKCEAKVSLAQFERSLVRGGMPGICFLRDEDEFENAVQLWLETTCFRDLARVLRKDLDGDLAMEILGTLASCEEPTAAEVASRLKKDARVVKRYLEGFCRILVLQKLSPHRTGVGKDQYLLIDSGLARFLGAPSRTVLRIHVLIEALSHFEAIGIPRPRLEYYRTAKRSEVPLVFSWVSRKYETLAVQISEGESPSRGEIASLDGFTKRFESSVRQVLLSHTQSSYREGREGRKGSIEVHPLRG